MPYTPPPPPRRDNRALYLLIGVLCALVVLLALVFLVVTLRQKPRSETATAQEAPVAQEAPAAPVKHDTVIIREKETVRVPVAVQQPAPKAQASKPKPATSATNSSNAWHIRDLSGLTNIRNNPRGQVCMKLKAHTRYDIYADARSGSWLRIASIYNATEGYWVRLHSSSTGTYWISADILY